MSIYTDEFKNEVISLYNNQKTVKEIAEEYKVSKSSLYRWIKQHSSAQSFKTKEHLPKLENELFTLKNQLIKLQVENDRLRKAALNILKQTAQITGGK